jgi:hypothetical protein
MWALSFWMVLHRQSHTPLPDGSWKVKSATQWSTKWTEIYFKLQDEKATESEIEKAQDKFIETIQLDAQISGMKKAAEIAIKCYEDYENCDPSMYHMGENAGTDKVHSAILSAITELEKALRE